MSSSIPSQPQPQKSGCWPFNKKSPTKKPDAPSAKPSTPAHRGSKIVPFEAPFSSMPQPRLEVTTAPTEGHKGLPTTRVTADGRPAPPPLVRQTGRGKVTISADGGSYAAGRGAPPKAPSSSGKVRPLESPIQPQPKITVEDKENYFKFMISSKVEQFCDLCKCTLDESVAGGSVAITQKDFKKTLEIKLSTAPQEPTGGYFSTTLQNEFSYLFERVSEKGIQSVKISYPGSGGFQTVNPDGTLRP